MSEFNYLDDLYGQKIFDIKDLKELANRLEKVVKEDPTYNAVKGFFFWALDHYYTSYAGPNDFYGITKNVGHIIYRLSDFIPKEERKNIPVDPARPTNKDAKLMMEMSDGAIPWVSLEDWRKEWEKDHPYIPNVIKRIPSSFKFLEQR